MTTVIHGNQIQYLDIGRGPAVVIAQTHEFERKFWQSQAELLKKRGFRVVQCMFSDKLSEKIIVGLMNYLGLGRAVIVGLTNNAGLFEKMRSKYSSRIAATCLISPVEQHKPLSQIRCNSKSMPDHVLIGDQDHLAVQMIDHSLLSQKEKGKQAACADADFERATNDSEVSRLLLKFLRDLYTFRPRHLRWTVWSDPGFSTAFGRI